MQYLVTTNKDLLPATPIAMVDGTVPGYEKRKGDLHFDHHRIGGEQIQIDEMPIMALWRKEITHMVTTQVDADACVAAAYLQLDLHLEPGSDTHRKLRAIAFDCDHLSVPDELSDLAEFAAQAVAALKAEEFKLADILGLPKQRSQWTEDNKVRYFSESFRQGTEWLIAAVKGERHYPGELGEAAEYWKQVKNDEQQLIDENRITKYKDALIFNMLGWKGRYVDPRASFRAAKHLQLGATIALTYQETYDGSGWCYKISSSSNNLLTGFDAFFKLTIAEAKKRSVNCILVERFWGESFLSQEIGFDPWGGRETVGGSGWRTPSLLTPEEVIDCLMQ